MNYHIPMEFEWDEAKSETCFQERGFDFAYVARAPRPDAIRIISARKANKREVNHYEKSTRNT